jgi:hypothetical protein
MHEFCMHETPTHLGVKAERIRTDSSETIFVTIFSLDSDSERIVCGYEYKEPIGNEYGPNTW